MLKSLFEEHNKVCMYVCMYVLLPSSDVMGERSLFMAGGGGGGGTEEKRVEKTKC